MANSQLPDWVQSYLARKHVPDWVQPYLEKWQKRLGLSEWSITVRAVLCVNEDPEARACCEQFPDISNAIITLRADIEDNGTWKATLLHELLHIAHARIDHLIETAIIPELPAGTQDLARRVYRHPVEPFIESLAFAFWQMESEMGKEREGDNRAGECAPPCAMIRDEYNDPIMQCRVCGKIIDKAESV